MNLERAIRIWYRIAVICCVFTFVLVGVSVFIEWISGTQCRVKLHDDPIAGALFCSSFMVFFFHRAQTNALISKTNDTSNGGAKYIRVFAERIPITLLHIFYLAFFGFCAFTFAAPIMAILILRFVAINCGYL